MGHVAHQVRPGAGAAPRLRAEADPAPLRQRPRGLVPPPALQHDPRYLSHPYAFPVRPGPAADLQAALARHPAAGVWRVDWDRGSSLEVRAVAPPLALHSGR